MKIFYFLLESLLKELLNIKYFTSKLILSKSILIKLILSKINFIKVQPYTPYRKLGSNSRLLETCRCTCSVVHHEVGKSTLALLLARMRHVAINEQSAFFTMEV